jgi:integrase
VERVWVASQRACRTGDILGPKGRDDRPPLLWDHITRADRLWTVPKTKNGSTHRVPLCDRAMEILQTTPRFKGLGSRGDPRVFAGLQDRDMLNLLKEIRPGLTVHGFRSTFSDWAHDTTAYPKVVIDMALAHTVGNKVEAAYRRGELFEKRRRLMAEWERYCEQTPVASESPAVFALRR